MSQILFYCVPVNQCSLLFSSPVAGVSVASAAGAVKTSDSSGWKILLLEVLFHVTCVSGVLATR